MNPPLVRLLLNALIEALLILGMAMARKGTSKLVGKMAFIARRRLNLLEC